MKSSGGAKRDRVSRKRTTPASPAGQAAGGRAALRKRRKKQGGKRALKVAGLLMGFVLLLGAGSAAFAYWKLNSNITSDALSANGKDGAGHERVDAFGRSPINILVIGSDGRTDASDCKLGGACKTATGARADVEMVVHISADRSNAMVMSIPRDLRSDWSGCHDKNHLGMGPQKNQMINSALSGGPGCSVVAVHELTGIPIDHFAMIDFSGVVDISEAVGGVSACVDKNVYDPYSHLKLKAGTHILKGQAALEFLRTRHGFGDASDSRGRTVAQHQFLNSLLGQLKNKGTLGSPTKMWGIANAATNALTVDNGPAGLDSAPKLIDLAGDLDKVPTSHIRWATMQTQDVTVQGVSQTRIGAGAKAMFQSIANDQSLTEGTSKAGPAMPSLGSSPLSIAAIAVDVENGTTVEHRASAIAQELIGEGFSTRTRSGNGSPATTTSLTYPADQKAQAQSVAKALGLPARTLKQGTGAGISLLIGADWSTGTSYPGGKAALAPVDTRAALSGTNSQLGTDKECTKVSTFNDVIGLDANGRPTTSDHPVSSTSPSRAYALSPDVKDSAP
ncbi:LCP family protein [Streptomyces sp. NBC_01497]|uniref:LCP family protein n=1 Tax=Streptomyces sp. NBC_01497 TaxID=2903885 RepID=UPI002E346343|nr:LCP family protein [Streptomyces sp. NBC_01497]